MINERGTQPKGSGESLAFIGSTKFKLLPKDGFQKWPQRLLYNQSQFPIKSLK